MGKISSRQKLLFALRKITNNWFGEEGTMDCRPFYFNFLIFDRTEYETGYFTRTKKDSQSMKALFLKQLNSSNN